MKLIKPSQISGEIMTLIEEADNRLIIVSPYCKFSDWKKFLNTIDYLKRKNTPVEFYVRKGEAKTFEEVREIGFNPIQIPNLHTKLYINEKYAIVSSMNLLTYSDNNSLDIAYKTETDAEYDELIEYYNRYLKIHDSLDKHEIQSNSYDSLNHHENIFNGEWDEYAMDFLEDEIEQNINYYFEDDTLIIQCKNRYEVFISNERKNNLNINGVLTRKEAELLKPMLKRFKEKSGLDVSIEKYNYNMVLHHSNIPLKSYDLIHLYKKDYNTVIQTIVDFVSTVESFKNHCWETNYQY